MSDLPIRRIDDLRMNNIEKTIIIMQKSVSKVEKKIFNGMSVSIKSTENKVDYIDARNREEHQTLIKSMKDMSENAEKRNDQLSKKFDKMLWFLMTSSIGISGGVIIAIVKDWI